jgi:hypothetical protein
VVAWYCLGGCLYWGVRPGALATGAVALRRGGVG